MSANPYGVRSATLADRDALVAFVVQYYGDQGAQPVSEGKVEALVDRCIRRDGAIAGIVDGPSGIEASIGAAMETFDYSDEPHLMVKWIDVAEAARKSSLGKQMVSYSRWLHDRMSEIAGQPMPVFLPVLTTVPAMRKVLSYNRSVPLVGTLFAFGCRPGTEFFGLGQMGTAKTPPRDSQRSRQSGRSPVLQLARH